MKKMIIQIMAGVFIIAMTSMVQADSMTLYETGFEGAQKHNSASANTTLDDNSASMQGNLTAEWQLTSANADHMIIQEDAQLSDFLRGGTTASAANLTLTGLDELLGESSRKLTLTFDFYAIDSWDGNNSYHSWGIDYFKIAGSYNNQWTVKRGTVNDPAIHSTFDDNFGNKLDRVERITGTHSWEDTIYRQVSVTFDHIGDMLNLSFSATGNGIQGFADESWGIDNVRIAKAPPAPSSVPEPGTFVLAAAGLLGLAGIMRKRNDNI